RGAATRRRLAGIAYFCAIPNFNHKAMTRQRGKEIPMPDWLPLVARLLLAQIFLGAGMLQLAPREAPLQQIATRGSGPLLALFLAGAVLVELVGGAALLVGFRATWAAALLAAWVLAATTLYHTDFRQPFQADLFAKDLAIVGGLLLIGAFGAGRISLDALLGLVGH